MGLLAVVFGLGLFSSLRSLRREAEATRIRAQFLTTVTHELKTPLAGIRLLAEMLEEGRVQAAELFGPVAERDGMRIALQLRETSMVRLDRGAFIQALLNVMDNARKYAAEGGRLDVCDVSTNGTYEVAIRDYGPGIPAEEAAQIFARFERGALHQSGSIPGVGLGLYLARTIARSHGGDLRVEAPGDGGAGACFRFILPLDTA